MKAAPFGAAFAYKNFRASRLLRVAAALAGAVAFIMHVAAHGAGGS